MPNDTYKRINNAVNTVFFDGRYQSLSVYLDIENDVSEEIANILSIDPDELEHVIGNSVSCTLRFDEANIYSWHKKNLDKWLTTGFESKPPFSALLLSFSIAAERMRQGEKYSSTNYYRRLCEVFGTTTESHMSKVSAAGRYTEIFWKALNFWLIKNDYAYGRPTAKPVNQWKYVSYALSQSLVRDADRKRLHRLFVDYGLSAHENLGESEIMLYLHEWMTGSGPSAWLKKLWSVPELRERISASAISELDCWDGGDFHIAEGGFSVRRLSWMAHIKSFLRTQVNLYLAASKNNESESTELNLSEGSTEIATKAFEDCDHVWLATLQNGDMEYIEPRNKLNLDALLLASFELLGKSSLIKYTHDARPIIPLIKVECNPYYREVSRISLYSNHIILCHEKWKDNVNEHLKKYARTGFTIRDCNPNIGLPSQWSLIQDVEVVRIPTDDVNNNMQCLVPLSEGVNIYFKGGLKLAQNIWHEKAPPEVFASDDTGALSVELKTDELGSKGNVICKQDASSFNPNFLASVQTPLESQNFIITGIKENRPKVEKEISFRSAETPRRFLPSRDVELVYSLDKNIGRAWGLSASPKEKIDTTGVTLEGMILSGDSPVKEPIILPDKYKSLDVSYDESMGTCSYNISDIDGVADTCILRGYHYWMVEPDSSSMTCKDCNLFQIVKKRRSRRTSRDTTRPTNNVHHEAEQDNHLTSIRKQPSNVITADIVYDAICYLGSGNWSGLQSILSVLVEEPWQVSTVARNLVDLGLVDIMLNDNDYRPSHWFCVPPTIVLTHNGSAFLVGFRNDTLLGEIQESFAKITEFYRIEQQLLAPNAHLWDFHADCTGELESLLSRISDPNGRHIKVVQSPAEPIITAMPSVSEMILQLRSIYIEDRGDIEKFNPSTGKWQEGKLHGPGAYRTFFGGRKYFYHDNNNNSHEASFELVKLLAAREHGVYIHGYNQDTSSFECVVGCEPPGLYRRALVSCSGVLPTLNNGKLTYSNIPKELALLLMYKLYE